MKKVTRHMLLPLSVREQKAIVDALNDAAGRAPRDSRFRDWATSIAARVKAAGEFKGADDAPPTDGKIVRDVWAVFNAGGQCVALLPDAGTIEGFEGWKALQGEFRAYAHQPRDLVVEVNRKSQIGNRQSSTGGASC